MRRSVGNAPFTMHTFATFENILAEGHMLCQASITTADTDILGATTPSCVGGGNADVIVVGTDGFLGQERDHVPANTIRLARSRC